MCTSSTPCATDPAPSATSAPLASRLCWCPISPMPATSFGSMPHVTSLPPPPVEPEACCSATSPLLPESSSTVQAAISSVSRSTGKLINLTLYPSPCWRGVAVSPGTAHQGKCAHPRGCCTPVYFRRSVARGVRRGVAIVALWMLFQSWGEDDLPNSYITRELFIPWFRFY